MQQAKRIERDAVALKEIDQSKLSLITVGDSGVGKTAIIRRLASDEFIDHAMSTVGIDVQYVDIKLDGGKKANLALWDTAGSERYRTMTRQYYVNKNIILLVFDLTNPKSLAELENWYSEVVVFADRNTFSLVLIGNKSDQNVLIPDERVREFAKRIGADDWFTMSAKTDRSADLIPRISRLLDQPVNRAVPRLGLDLRGEESACCALG